MSCASAHHVVLADGERLGYTKLLLAIGATSRPLPVPGGRLDGVLTLRRLADSDRIKTALAAGARVVVIGAGWIGLETAAAARQAGAAVSLVEQAELPLLRALGPEVAHVFADLHREHGVDLRLRRSRRLRPGGDPRRHHQPAVPRVLAPEQRVVSGMNVNIWDEGDAIKALVRAQVRVPPDQLADPAIPLAELVDQDTRAAATVAEHQKQTS